MLQDPSLGMFTLGFGHQASDNRIADDFTISAPGGWVIDAVTYFAYQTGSSTTSTFAEANLRIWDGPPGGMGSTVIWGDTTTNLLVDTGWSVIYRVSETTPGDNQRPVMANKVSLGGLFLPQGTYWLDWQADGDAGLTGPWAPPITINGQSTTGNALQYSNLDGTAVYDWRPVEDSGTFTPQGFPFLIEGVVAGCSPSDIPWVSVAPDMGTTPGGSSTNIDVTFDSTGLSPGTYTGDLCIFSNDLSHSLVVVPLTLHVFDEMVFLPLILNQP
jgi:hypothetical protein